MNVALASLIAFGVAMPHVLSLRTAPPTVAVAIWSSALLLRAVASSGAVLFLIVQVPRTNLFNAVTHWCLHAVLPLLATHMGLDGHRIGDAATIVPALVLVGSALSVGFGILTAARSLRRLLHKHALGPGPEGSLIIGGRDVMLAAAGFRRPRIVVSAGALTALDDAELAAGLAHERGHITRRHRYLLTFGTICRASGCFIPGGRRALLELAFHLERDADRFALRRHDRLALASAICKAAVPRAGSALLALGGAGVTERLRQLLDEHAQYCRKSRATALSGLAIVMVALSLATSVVVPAAGYAAVSRADDTAQLPHCRQ